MIDKLRKAVMLTQEHSAGYPEGFPLEVVAQVESALIESIPAAVSISKDRYSALMREEAELTPEEIKYGWHFCWEFDGLLICPGMPEMQFCKCTHEPEPKTS